MSTFWEAVQNQVESAVVEAPISNFWASVGLAPVKKAKVEKAIKPTKKSKAVEASVKVYETIDGLVTPDPDCVHHYVIGTKTPQDIGVCQKCNGERWFTNVYKDNFNDSPINYKADDIIEIRDAEKQTSAIQDSANIEEGV